MLLSPKSIQTTGSRDHTNALFTLCEAIELREHGLTKVYFEDCEEAKRYCYREPKGIGVEIINENKFAVHMTKLGAPYNTTDTEPRWMYLKAYYKDRANNEGRIKFCKLKNATSIQKKGRIKQCYFLPEVNGTIQVIHHSCKALNIDDEKQCNNCKMKRRICSKGSRFYNLCI